MFGILFGFLSSLLPEFFKVYQDKKDKDHELALFKLQMENIKLAGTEKRQEIDLQGNLAREVEMYKTFYPAAGTASKKTIDYISSVRPTITYLFMSLFIIVQLCLISIAFEQGVALTVAVAALWTTGTSDIFGVILGFWFGDRMITKKSK